LGFSLNTGRGGSYYYFFCLGRAEKRTNCDLPYLQADLVEDATFDLWHRTSLTDQQADVIRHLVRDELDRLRTGRSSDLKSIERTVAKLTGTKQRLLDAYLAEAVQLADFRTKQELLDAQLSAAQRRLNDLTEDYESVEARVEIVLSLLRRAGDFYAQCPEDSRALLNRAVFTRILVDVHENGPTSTGQLTDIVKSVLVAQAPDPATQSTSRPPTYRKNPRQAFQLAEGSNVGHLVGSSISESKKKKWPMAIEAARAAEALRPEASQYSNRSLDPDSSLTHLSQRRVSTKQTQAMVEAYRAGESVGAIAKRLGFHRGTVAAHLKEAGLIVRADPRNPETCRRVVEVYQRVGSYKGTARELGICHKTVRKIVTRSENQ